MIAVRPYRPSDLEALVALFTRSVHELAAPYYDEVQRRAWAPQPPDLEGWRVRLEKIEVRVADRGGDVAGFIGFEGDGHIDLLFTSPSHVGSGVASALYRSAEAELVGLGVSELFAEVSLAARPFFERQGFRVAGEEVVTRRGARFVRFEMRKASGADSDPR